MKQHESKTKVRKPRQNRSKETKKQIVLAAYELFCEKGYFKTSTNEIALLAGVSIGSFYAYFKNKDQVFSEVLAKYHEDFRSAQEDLLQNPELFAGNYRKSLRLIFDKLIKIHEDSKEFNRELTVLAFYNAELADILRRNKQETLDVTMKVCMSLAGPQSWKDAEATAYASYDLISATVDRIVFDSCPSSISRERLIEAALDLLCT